MAPKPPPKKAAAAYDSEGDDGDYDSADDGSYDDDEYAKDKKRSVLDDQPETTIGEAVKLKGELSFDRLLRIDGVFEGALNSTGDLIIGPSGKLIGDVKNMGELVVDGKVVGNVNVEKVELRGNAQVHGSITCKSLTVDPDVMICGTLNVNPFAPEKVDTDGKLIVPEEAAAA